MSQARTLKKLEAVNKATHPDYHIQLLTAEHTEQTARLFAKSFCEREPLTKNLNIQLDDFLPFARLVAAKAAKDQVSCVGISAQGEVIACAIAEDIADALEVKPGTFPKLDPILEYLEALSSHFVKDKIFAQGKISHFWVTAVDDRYMGNKLSQEINMAVIKQLEKAGFLFICAEFTSAINEKLMDKFPSSYRHTLPYNGFPKLRRAEGRGAVFLWPVNEDKANVLDLHSCYRKTAPVAEAIQTTAVVDMRNSASFSLSSKL